MKRCPWAKTPLLISYHDAEWGVPLHDDTSLFELLVLEGAQAGLSWETVLRKRRRYRELFGGFDPLFVGAITPEKIAEFMADSGIIRSRVKIESAVTNARAIVRLRAEMGTFDRYVWRFVGGGPLDGRRRSVAQVPTMTDHSRALSADLLRRGFRFVGPTICYSFMQAAGLVNDHLLSCPWHDR